MAYLHHGGQHGRREASGSTITVESAAIQLYGVDPLHDLIVDEVLRRAGKAHVRGIQWLPSLPPIESLKLEIDVRSSGTELVLPA